MSVVNVNQKVADVIVLDEMHSYID